ncbi:cell division protein FtsL [Aliiruegeria sabulilitoris]|uniref:cell division protein FtsL n=1 Tax=Aliiruegeria sabulilitoris TaxID=1510458 RepID=UPI00082BFFF0|nr:cell division protein FtsL [Aliiruegeria sabulilitoris]NDR56580.1 cell division protein FtsL [Pseudoruegeria sp. M32A2M]
MKTFFYLMSALFVMGLAFWAYQENYQTQAALKQSAVLKREIGDLRQELAVLEAEWAYLNRPGRLAELAEINFDTLGLLPLMPEQFGSLEQVAFPPLPGLAISDPIEVRGHIAVGGQFP